MSINDLFQASTIEADSDTERTCGTCGKRKPLSDFYKDGIDSNGNTKYRRDCKDCYRKVRTTERRAKRQAMKPTPVTNKRRRR